MICFDAKLERNFDMIVRQRKTFYLFKLSYSEYAFYNKLTIFNL